MHPTHRNFNQSILIWHCTYVMQLSMFWIYYVTERKSVLLDPSTKDLCKEGNKVPYMPEQNLPKHENQSP